jgi:hypothetical protein
MVKTGDEIEVEVEMEDTEGTPSGEQVIVKKQIVVTSEAED